MQIIDVQSPTALRGVSPEPNYVFGAIFGRYSRGIWSAQIQYSSIKVQDISLQLVVYGQIISPESPSPYSSSAT
jgi:hypothetical protein